MFSDGSIAAMKADVITWRGHRGSRSRDELHWFAIPYKPVILDGEGPVAGCCWPKKGDQCPQSRG